MLQNKERAQQELNEVNAHQAFSAQAVYEDFSQWTATVKGPANTPYEGGVFKLDVQYPPGYPDRPPQVYFITKVYHPNISPKGIQLDILEDRWSPNYNVVKILEAVLELLKNPEVEGALVPDVADEYKSDHAKFEATAKEWTKSFASEA